MSEENKMNINWFPGHMAKTEKLIKENLKLVDIVIEILDARIPISSKNPLIDEICLSKPRLVVFNKFDMADEKITKEWEDYYKERGLKLIKTNSISGEGFSEVVSGINYVLSDKIKKYKENNMNYVIKMMVVGIPNVGKSSFINRLTNRASARTGDRPGITKGKQWIRINKNYELLDTPGILWHKFKDDKVGLHLAFTGAIRSEVTDNEEICYHLLNLLKEKYKESVEKRYNISFDGDTDAYDIMLMIGKKRGFIVKGGEVDLTRTSNAVLDEFRSIKLGRISLETKNDITGF